MISVKYGEPKKLAGLQSIYVTFPYNDVIVNLLRTKFDVRAWDSKNKCWELPYDAFSKLKELMPKEKFKVEGTPINDKRFGEKILEEVEIPKSVNAKLYEYQKQAFKEGYSLHKYIFDLEPGLGKSLISITTALALRESKGIKRALIIPCVNGLKYTWEEQILQFTDEKPIILGNRKKRNGFWATRSSKEKLEDLNNLTDKDFFIITNIESLRDKAIFEKIKSMCKSGEIDCIICDECHKCKTPSTIQGKALLALSKLVDYIYMLTGTVLMNSPLDLYVPLKCVGGEKVNFSQFKNYFAIFGGFGGYQIVGYKHLDVLQQKLDRVSIRVKKADVLELPPKIYLDEYVEMGAKQKKVYDMVLKATLSTIDSIVLSLNPLAQLTRLRQATADTSILSDEIQESAKFDRLQEILEEEISLGKDIIIYSNWTKVIDRAEELLKPKYKCAKITGDVVDREHEKDVYVNDKDCHILLGTIGALGTGYNLANTSTVIFLDEPWTDAVKNQAEDRAYRIGTNGSVNIITLLCKGTIDEQVHKIIKKKRNLSDAIVDKKFDVKNKEVIKFLITGEGDIDSF